MACFAFRGMCEVILLRYNVGKVLLTIAALGPALALGLPSDRSQPVAVEADRVEMDQQANRSIYTGQVHMRQGTMVVTGDRIVADHDPQGASIRKATVDGRPATYEQVLKPGDPPVHARALRMIYNAEQQTLHLLGEAYVSQGTNTLAGNDILYNLATNRMVAQGSENKRIRIQFTPPPPQDQNTTKPGAKAGAGARPGTTRP